MHARATALAAGFLALVAFGCSESPTESAPITAVGSIGPLCQLGCTEIDSFPAAPGVFLGSGVTPDVCIDGGYTDADQDRLGDFCEKQLAAAFAPELYYWSADNVGREPHWAARVMEEERIWIVYLLSYYRDEGSRSFWCRGQSFYVEPSCFGHNGDSEAIILDLYYDTGSHHWVLHEALYSQHGDFVHYPRGAKAYPTQLLYPGHPGGYPRSYVAQGKHANYRNKQECDDAGFWNADTCEEVNTAARVAIGTILNIGSSIRHSASQDCMPTSNPAHEYYGSGREECYWTPRSFRGWIPTTVGGAQAGPYSTILQWAGF